MALSLLQVVVLSALGLAVLLGLAFAAQDLLRGKTVAGDLSDSEPNVSTLMQYVVALRIKN